MIGKFEKITHPNNVGLWAGKYKNLEILPHWHIDHEIIHCETGNIFVTLNGQLITLYPGDSVYCYSRDIHKVSAAKGAINSMIVFNPLKLAKNFPISRLQNPVVRNDTLFHAAFDIIYRELNERSLYYEELCYSSLCQYLILLIRDSPHNEPFDRDMPHQVAVQKQLIEMLTSSSYMTFHDAARKMGYSDAYFSRYFKNIFGVTFSRYMNAIKIADAVQLLCGNPNISVTQVAGQCGFNTIRHFNRVFKELTGISPSEFASSNIDHYTPSLHLGKNFTPTLSTSILINYLED